MTLTIGETVIGRGQPCRFIAELGNAHGGDSDRMVRLIKAAKAAGADLIKTQCFVPSELVALRGDGPAPEPWGSQGWTTEALYTKAATPLEWFEWIPEVCAAVGIDWFSSFFGMESLDTLIRANVPALKIARLDNQHTELADAARATGKPLIVSQYNEPLPACNAVLLCFPGYPQTSFPFTRDLFTEYDGFSYHGTSIVPPITAAEFGATMIEAHFQLDNEPSELEAAVSLNASAFRRMVATVREYEAVTG